MTNVVLLLGDAARWLRIEDGAIVARGDGFSPEMPDEVRVVAVVPAREVAVHQANLPNLSEPQARAAARLLVAEQSAGASDGLHIAIGPEGANGDRTIVAIEAAHMARHLAELATLGIDPDAMLAAPLLLPRPTEGWLRGDLGEEVVVRGRDAAFADDAVLTPMVTGGAAVVDLDHDALEAAVVAAAETPEVDLRQPPFAKLRRWSIDWPLVRRLAVLGLLLATATLAVEIVTIAKLNATADRIEAANAIRARAALPPG
ncbi:MAG: general secretion pathway protein GspL, partial [Sphingomonadaceae bacterium]|nr:general secretion pathway protein GspL [Sphingomonadaceae bacterium]